MKFGKSIGSQQDNHAGLHYIDYKLLKKRIKDVVECQQAHQLADALTANTSFEEELIREIGLVNHCFADQQQELLMRTGSLAETLPAAAASRSACSSDFAAASTSASSSGSNGGARTPSERAQAFRALIGILSSVDQLRKYAVWNAVAVVKILKKRRKQTSFGLEDTAAERAGWLSRQSFFSGSDFAELHAAVESLGHELVLSELGPSGLGTASRAANPAAIAADKEPEQCPICLDTISDMVELGCNHRFCWKCFVLGPIAHQPGEYRITQCPICRRNTELGEEGEEEQDAAADTSCDAEHGAGAGVGASEESAMMPSGSEGLLTRFLHTYFPPEQDEPPSIFLRQGTEDADGASACAALAGFDDEEHESRDIVSELVRALLAGQQRPGAASGRGAPGAASAAGSAHADANADAGPSGQAAGSAASEAGAAGGATSSGSAAPGDFFQTLPLKSKQDKQMLGAAQKLQWLQLASTGDPLAVEGTTYCSLCSEPLLMEAVVSTPCKHYFHKVCVRRLDCPQCPLCSCALPFSWFVPNGHPCSERGFRVVAPEKYRPAFPGGPSKGSGGYPLRQPPPMVLRGGAGLLMKSYLHRIPPPTTAVQASAGEDDEDSEGLADTPEQAASSASESSSEDSGSEDDHHHQHHHFRRGERRQAFGCSGRMRLVVAPATVPEPPVFANRSFNHAIAAPGAGLGGPGGSGSGGDDELAPPAMSASMQQAPQVLLIGDHV